MILRINTDFQKLLWPLTPDEYATLETSVIKEGCRDAIVVTGSVIVDGHNRYNICHKNNINFTTSSIDFANEEVAKEWIDKNQTGRRNVTPDQLRVIRGRRYKALKNTQGGDRKSKGQNDLLNNTAQILAKEYGVSEKTIKRDAQFAIEVEETPELLEAVKNKLPIKQAKNVIYKKEESKKKDVSNVVITNEDVQLYNTDILDAPIKDNSIDVIVSDPPYPKEYTPCWRKLAEFAAKKLKDGGVLIAMSGQQYLPEVYAGMNVQGLNYYWTCCVQNTVSPDLWTVRTKTQWKPILWYVKGKYTRTYQGTDVFTPTYKDTAQGQQYHKWGQSLPLFEELIEKFSYAGEVVCDPYLGGATTAIACINKKRKFIGIELDKNIFNIASNRIAEVLC